MIGGGGGGAPLVTRYWGGGGGSTRHFFSLRLYNFKNILGGTCFPCPPPPPLLRGPCYWRVVTGYDCTQTPSGSSFDSNKYHQMYVKLNILLHSQWNFISAVFQFQSSVKALVLLCPSEVWHNIYDNCTHL